MAVLHELDAGANLSLLPDCRKKLIPYNPKAKMHKPDADACPKVVSVQALRGSRLAKCP
ncbi:MAG: hypothetical protein IPN63_11120 [Gammaproteobacteria bacterium]|nr:hypothetical protein [Gammaproteobacteria bacterium]MBK9427902.1 hypothetical protein [Gammaproteobacteria bacterium]